MGFFTLSFFWPYNVYLILQISKYQCPGGTSFPYSIGTLKIFVKCPDAVGNHPCRLVISESGNDAK